MSRRWTMTAALGLCLLALGGAQVPEGSSRYEAGRGVDVSKLPPAPAAPLAANVVSTCEFGVFEFGDRMEGRMMIRPPFPHGPQLQTFPLVHRGTFSDPWRAGVQGEMFHADVLKTRRFFLFVGMQTMWPQAGSLYVYDAEGQQLGQYKAWFADL